MIRRVLTHLRAIARNRLPYRPSGERPDRKAGRRDYPCEGMAAPSQRGIDRPPRKGFTHANRVPPRPRARAP